MTDQPQPDAAGNTSAADPGHDRKTPAKRVTLGTGQRMILAGYVQRLCARIADALVFVIGFAVLLQIDVQALGQHDELYVLAILFAPIINEFVAVACCGRTLGMQLLGIRIVSKRTGQKPSVIAAFLRWIFQILVFLFILSDDTSGYYGGAIIFWAIIGICWWLLVHFSV